jgi:PhnB protein
MIAYVDAQAAIDWLTDAFGFPVRECIIDEGGTVMHAELETNEEGGVVMLATPSADYEGPRLHGERCERARAWLAVPWIVDGVLVYVDDVDAHFARFGARGWPARSAP